MFTRKPLADGLYLPFGERSRTGFAAAPASFPDTAISASPTRVFIR
ncbi:hypothetical protein QZM79_10265 [Burkholderia multivorans]|nr:hypothetical protein [Burkholderia multivorans]